MSIKKELKIMLLSIAQKIGISGLLGFRLFRKLSIGLIGLLCFYGCSSNKNDRKMGGIDSVHNEVRTQKELKAKDTIPGNDITKHENLSCNKLLDSLIKTSSIDKNLLYLSDNERIDSIKNGILNITLYHENGEPGDLNVANLTLNIEKKELRILDINSDAMKKLEVNTKLLELILQRDCYRGRTDEYGKNSDK